VLISKFINIQLNDRQDLLTKIHEIILEEDKTVKAEVKPMMGKEMIIIMRRVFLNMGFPASSTAL